MTVQQLMWRSMIVWWRSNHMGWLGASHQHKILTTTPDSACEMFAPAAVDLPHDPQPINNFPSGGVGTAEIEFQDVSLVNSCRLEGADPKCCRPPFRPSTHMMPEWTITDQSRVGLIDMRMISPSNCGPPPKGDSAAG